jgi:hypothetical protein
MSLYLVKTNNFLFLDATASNEMLSKAMLNALKTSEGSSKYALEH